MQTSLIGRNEEKATLNELLKSKRSELLAVYGRRRVGKTFLIHSAYEKEIVFEMSGIHKANLNSQLANFFACLQKHFGKRAGKTIPETWQEAFHLLGGCLDKLKTKRKKVLFFDEFPWIGHRRSGFLTFFGHFWNTWAANRTDIIVVICGSAASWMIQKVLGDRGGLHNRVTERLRLNPFTLKETKMFLEQRKIVLNNAGLLQLYMAIGGIPFYLSKIQKGKSVNQIIDKLCFSKNGILFNEFENLYDALFDNADKHHNVVKALAGKNSGLTRNQILKTAKLATGGTHSKLFRELEESGFISGFYPFGKKKKETRFRLTDPFSLFYLKFIDGHKQKAAGSFQQLSNTQGYKTWCGYAFENICLSHIDEIKKELGIGGVYSEQSSWVRVGKKNKNGAQIDLVIDRQDHCINLCEIKFSHGSFYADKKTGEYMNKTRLIFMEETKTRKQIITTLITSSGAQLSDYAATSIDLHIDAETFFQ